MNCRNPKCQNPISRIQNVESPKYQKLKCRPLHPCSGRVVTFQGAVKSAPCPFSLVHTTFNTRGQLSASYRPVFVYLLTLVTMLWPIFDISGSTKWLSTFWVFRHFGCFDKMGLDNSGSTKWVSTIRLSTFDSCVF